MSKFESSVGLTGKVSEKYNIFDTKIEFCHSVLDHLERENQKIKTGN